MSDFKVGDYVRIIKDGGSPLVVGSVDRITEVYSRNGFRIAGFGFVSQWIAHWVPRVGDWIMKDGGLTKDAWVIESEDRTAFVQQYIKDYAPILGKAPQVQPGLVKSFRERNRTALEVTRKELDDWKKQVYNEYDPFSFDQKVLTEPPIVRCASCLEFLHPCESKYCSKCDSGAFESGVHPGILGVAEPESIAPISSDPIMSAFIADRRAALKRDIELAELHKNGPVMKPVDLGVCKTTDSDFAGAKDRESRAFMLDQAKQQVARLEKKLK